VVVPRDLMFPVAPTVPLRGFQAPDAAGERLLRRAVAALPSRPDRFLMRACYSHTSRRSEHLRSVRSQPKAGSGGAYVQQNCRSLTLPEHPFDSASHSPRHGRMSRRCRLRVAAIISTEVRMSELREGTSLRSLQPTCCQRAPCGSLNLEVPGFRPSARRFRLTSSVGPRSHAADVAGRPRRRRLVASDLPTSSSHGDWCHRANRSPLQRA
jgi:hypothetical protein